MEENKNLQRYEQLKTIIIAAAIIDIVAIICLIVELLINKTNKFPLNAIMSIIAIFVSSVFITISAILIKKEKNKKENNE